ncbi:metallophosphoesterase family protein [Novosphingobium humi]|uniref:metallophosphoesterase family protein n=1 Tax=Novosphingobium humi TaxID=2282397 RepID=UPI0025AFDA26|nr:metallophosphoesterase family protein [Novosphingobium humi]WJT00001.1 serine/threonine protein phosphatase [Novosphingobium humi]
MRKLFAGTASASPPRIPDGQRVFAIGDIHGRLDLFEALMEAIEAEDQQRGPAQTTVILLGDLIDRGPASLGVLALARQWQQERRAAGKAMHILMGNHEEMLIHSLDRIEVLRQFVQHGGRETIMSFGIDEKTYADASWEELQTLMRQAVTQEWLDFIGTFEGSLRVGDYAFVHAGIRPGVALDDQTPADLRWIREPFLSSEQAHGSVIVHGHTIADAPEIRRNRIGIDTGAYQSGRLTALLLEGEEQLLLSTVVDEDKISIRLEK